MRQTFDFAAVSLAGLVLGALALLPAPADALELRTVPADHIYVNAANPGAGQFDAVVQTIGVLNDGEEAVTLEAVEIDLMAGGRSFLTKRVDPALFGRHTGFLGGMMAQGGMDAFIGGVLADGDGLEGFFGEGIALSREAALAPGTAALAVRQFVAFDQMPEAVRVSVRGVTASGEAVLATRDITVVPPDPERTYPMPLDGAWVLRAVPNITSHHRLVPSTEFAVDLFKINAEGRIYEGDPADQTNYFGYGEPVRAIAPGEVVQVINGTADDAAFRVRGEEESALAYNERMAERFDESQDVTDLASVAGNIVIIEQDDGYYAAYGHLAPSSVTVAEGDRIETGEMIATVGGTGEGNRTVHLHIQLNEGPDTLYSQGVPLRFAEETPDADTARFIRSE
jgi:hypothetical protein